MNDTGNRVIVGIIVVLLIIGAWYLGSMYKPGSTTGSMSTSTDMTSSSTDTTGNTQTGHTNNTGTTNNSSANMNVGGKALSVQDQPAGSFVVVSSATLPQAGWVAVRDASGRTLGAAWLSAGTHQAVQVPLLRNTVAGGTYQVLIYSDNGDKVFDLHGDTLVMNSDGSVAGASFSATNGD